MERVCRPIRDLRAADLRLPPRVAIDRDELRADALTVDRLTADGLTAD
jgi:hypothetical protein